MESTTIAVDLAKSVFQVAVSHRAGQVSLERRLPRARFLTFFAQQPPATVLLEACGSAHHWARQLQQCGHDVRLLPAHDVHRYVRRDKTDRGDAKALLEAARNDEIRTVPVKTVDQQMIASLHRVRSTWLATRTARLTTVRGLLREFGIVIPVGAQHVVPMIHALVDDARVPALLQPVLATTATEIRTLEATIHGIDQQLATLARQAPDAALLQTVPGVGVITATALLAAVGDIRRFQTGRHFASFLGLTAKETSSGEHRRLGAISKRGDTYLRMLLIHGGRSVLWSAKGKAAGDGLRAWALRTEQRRGHNVAAVAVANKLARIVWAVWSRQQPYTGSGRTA
jgi:transposase